MRKKYLKRELQLVKTQLQMCRNRCRELFDELSTRKLRIEEMTDEEKIWQQKAASEQQCIQPNGPVEPVEHGGGHSITGTSTMDIGDVIAFAQEAKEKQGNFEEIINLENYSKWCSISEMMKFDSASSELNDLFKKKVKEVGQAQCKFREDLYYRLLPDGLKYRDISCPKSSKNVADQATQWLKDRGVKMVFGCDASSDSFSLWANGVALGSGFMGYRDNEFICEYREYTVNDGSDEPTRPSEDDMMSKPTRYSTCDLEGLAPNGPFDWTRKKFEGDKPTHDQHPQFRDIGIRIDRYGKMVFRPELAENKKPAKILSWIGDYVYNSGDRVWYVEDAYTQMANDFEKFMSEPELVKEDAIERIKSTEATQHRADQEPEQVTQPGEAD